MGSECSRTGRTARFARCHRGERETHGSIPNPIEGAGNSDRPLEMARSKVDGYRPQNEVWGRCPIVGDFRFFPSIFAERYPFSIRSR